MPLCYFAFEYIAAESPFIFFSFSALCCCFSLLSFLSLLLILCFDSHYYYFIIAIICRIYAAIVLLSLLRRYDMIRFSLRQRATRSLQHISVFTFFVPRFSSRPFSLPLYAIYFILLFSPSLFQDVYISPCFDTLPRCRAYFHYFHYFFLMCASFIIFHCLSHTTVFASHFCRCIDADISLLYFHDQILVALCGVNACAPCYTYIIVIIFDAATMSFLSLRYAFADIVMLCVYAMMPRCFRLRRFFAFSTLPLSMITIIRFRFHYHHFTSRFHATPPRLHQPIITPTSIITSRHHSPRPPHHA